MAILSIGDSIQLDGKRAEITHVIGTWSGGTKYPNRNIDKSRGLIVNAVCGERSYRHVLVDGNGVGKARYGWTKK